MRISLEIAQYNSLAPRERQVLHHASRGLTNKAIADLMGITERTVKNYMGGIMCALGARKRTHAVALYLELPESVRMDTNGVARPQGAVSDKQ